MAKKKKPEQPITILIALQPDTSGTLLVQRGDWAVMQSFTYDGLKDIFEAVQTSAGRLLEAEQSGANEPAPTSSPSKPATAQTEPPSEPDESES